MMDFASFIQDNTVLRPHQIEAKAKIFEAWSKYDSVMLQMPAEQVRHICSLRSSMT